MRRFVTLALSMSLVLGLFGAAGLMAQDEKKPESKESAKPEKAKKPADEKDKAKAKEPAKAKADEESAAKEPPKVSNQDLSVKGDIPPEVSAKLEAARKAVAEAIVAAEDAGLVESTISPPPILDILILGRANDQAALKGASKETPEVGVSLEVFGAWYTGYGQMEGVTAEKNVRIVPPTKGLKTYFDTRSAVMTKYIQDARQAKAASAPKDDEKPKEEAKEETKPKADDNAAPAPKAEKKGEAKAKKKAKAKAEEKDAAEGSEPEDQPKPADSPSDEKKGSDESR